MHSQRNCCGSCRADKVCSRGRFPGSFSVQRSARSVINGWIVPVGFDMGMK